MTSNIRTGKIFSRDTTNTANDVNDVETVPTKTVPADFMDNDRAFYTPHLSGLTSLQDVLKERDRSPEKKEMRSKIRKEIAEDYYGGNETLTSLRLGKGWNQTEFAAQIGKQQPYISRIETNQDASNLTRGVMKAMCCVLDIDMNTLDAALDKQKSMKGT